MGHEPPSYIHLPLPSLNMYYRVPCSNTLRYLGFFLNHKLDWKWYIEVMCNWTCATLKALQILGNSICRLDHARWRLAYNAICLPVLTYGYQMWFTGKQKTLVKKLQTVQNEVVRIILGTFHTTPREPLHQLLTIFPIEVRLNMLLQNSALHLYKVPQESQLLRHLKGEWHTLDPSDPPLPTPNNNNAMSTQCKLATCVPANSPCINPFLSTPATASDWSSQVKVSPRNNEWNYHQTTETLINLCKGSSTINIFCKGTVSNKDQADNIQLGASAAVPYHGGREYSYKKWALGSTVTNSNSLLYALHPSLDVLTDLLSAQDAQEHTNAIICLSSNPTTIRALNASLHKDQQVSIDYLYWIDDLLNAFPHVKITLIWLPRSAPFMGYKRARQLALKAICTTDITTLEEPHMIRNQKEDSKHKAVEEWTKHWHKLLCDSLIYWTTLLKPPDSHTLPIFHLGSQWKAGNLNKHAKCSHATQATLYQLATGHAFIGAYTQCFYTQHMPEQIACPCGKPVQMVKHVLLHCPWHNASCQRHLTANGWPHGLSCLFTQPEQINNLLCFLVEMGTCAKLHIPWELGWSTQ